MSSETNEILYVTAPPAQLFCPLRTCKKVFQDPVTLTCGHSVCRTCANTISRCPVDNAKYDKKFLVPNRALEGQISDLLVYCSNSLKWNETLKKHEIDPSGCRSKIPLGEKEHHEASCEYRWVDCPVSGDLCQRIRFKDCEDHVMQCRRRDRLSTTSDTFIREMNEIRPEEGYTSPGICHCIVEVKRLRATNRELKDTVRILADRVKSLETTLNTSVNRMENLLYSMWKQGAAPLPTSDASAGDNGTKLVSPLTPGQSIFLKRPPVPCPLPRSRSGPQATEDVQNWVMPFTFKCTGILRGHKKMIKEILVVGEKIVTSSEDQTIKVWDVGFLLEGRIGQSVPNGCIATLKGHTAPVNCLCLGKGNTLISGDREANIKFWSLTDFKLIKEMDSIHAKELCRIVCSNVHMFTSSLGEISVWGLSDMAHVTTISGLNHYVRALVVAEDAHRLVAGAHGQIALYDISGGKADSPPGEEPPLFPLALKIKHAFGSIYSLAVNDNIIIVGTYNKCIQLFDLDNGEHISSLKGHLGAVNSLAVTSMGHFLLSANGDGSVQVWDLRSRLMVQQLLRHEDSAQALGLLRDLVFSGGNDAEIKVYKYFKVGNL